MPWWPLGLLLAVLVPALVRHALGRAQQQARRRTQQILDQVSKPATR
jgi:hypothetical protein